MKNKKQKQRQLLALGMFFLFPTIVVTGTMAPSLIEHNHEANFSAWVSETKWIAQTFICEDHGFVLTDVVLTFNYGVEEGDYYQVAIYETEDGKPSEQVSDWYNYIVDGSGLEEAHIDIRPIYIKQSEEYAIVIQANQANGMAIFSYNGYHSENDAYPNGMVCDSIDAGETWTRPEVSFMDLWFETWGYPVVYSFVIR